MARTPLYSRSPQRPSAPVVDPAAEPVTAAPAADTSSSPAPSATTPPPATPRRDRWRRQARWAGPLGLLGLVVLAGWPGWTAKVQRPLAIEQIDAALRESFLKQPLASAGVAAYEAILPSVVRVVGEPAALPAAHPPVGPRRPPGARPAKPGSEPEEPEGRSVGTGVVIVDKGLILTNLHVVDGAGRITVTFFDGSTSEASVVSLQPENDLAVLQARSIPDDLHAATLRSTAGLAPGEAVLAVGFPFGIGPSASQGVVSGLKREFRSPEGRRVLTNLIQFDAAANPGNSGGPLVTLDGHVVGIVTAIMNPNQQRTFIGIGFAVPIENAAAAVGMPPF